MTARALNNAPSPGFPTSAVVAALLLTAGALLAAALGWQWGAVPALAGWWTRAWLYVNLMLGFLWFVGWPTLTLRPGGDMRMSALVVPWLGVLVGGMPALLWAWYFGSPAAALLWPTLLMQACGAFFCLGVVSVTSPRGSGGSLPRAPGSGTWPAGILSFLYLLGPLLWYVAAEFTQCPRGWGGFAPAVDIFSAARGGGGPSVLWWAGGYGLSGVLLTGVAVYLGRRQSRPHIHRTRSASDQPVSD